jgi:DNA helicase-2/ATP-dependent DNA helicase PcrA
VTERTRPTPPALLTREDTDRLTGLTLTDEQWECVSAPLEPFVIVAGAGTGKTAVMATRVVWLVASGLVAEHQVLGLTFTNKAAAELAHRVTTLLTRWREQAPAGRDEEPGEPTIATYHSFARRLIDEQGLRVGIEPGARLLSGSADAQLAYRVVCDADGLEATHHAPATVAAALLKLDANLSEQTISTDELRAHDRRVIDTIDALPRTTRAVLAIRDTAARRMELATMVDRLRAERVRVGGLDFADHMRLCVDLVRSSDELVTAMRATYRVILLDEYQDTSIAQRVILSTLFAGSAVTAVGDPLQAIYGWRSASVANIAAFGAHFGAGGATPVRVLSVNRRSGDPILAAANRVAADLRVAHPEVAELRSPAARAAEVRAALLPTIADEREWIGDQVAAMVQGGRPAEEIAVLARANDSLGPIQEALAARGIPAYVSGAAAITASPFAMQVLATLRVLADPADNASLVTLLAGPRWRIGAHDLEQLGTRADVLAGGPAARRSRRAEQEDVEAPARSLRERLGEASAAPDPVERPSLLEAATDPGSGVSAAARERLAAFVAEIRHLQGRVGEPLADLAARIVQVTGAQVEADLAARRAPAGSAAPAAPSAAGNPSAPSAPSLPATPSPPDGDVGLDGLMQLVDGFSDAEGRSGLGAFLAYLDAAEQLGSGEQVDLPVIPGAVQLMTMHKAKGLQFPVVVVPHVANGSFPSSVGSERWTTQAHVVPSELRDDRHVLPALTGYEKKDLDAFLEACRAHDRSGDDRLAYVAVTRAQEVLIASSHWWGPTQKGLRGPSGYLEALREQAADSAGQLFTTGDPWADEPEGDESGDPPSNPLLDAALEVPWPPPDPLADDPLVSAARAVAALGEAAAADPAAQPPWEAPPPAGLPPEVAGQVAEWDAAIVALLARSRQPGDAGAVVRVPGVLSASATMELAEDPQAFAERLVRPMPRRRNRFADLGTAFHAWVEARLGLQPLIADDELPGAADEGIESAAELAALKDAFEALPYAARTPVGLEVPFSLALGGRLIRGRIDAVFPAAPDAPAGQLWEVVDWKTSQHDEADPLQLAIYREAWAQMRDIPAHAVGAAFVFVRSGSIVRPTDLPDAAGIAELIAGQ